MLKLQAGMFYRKNYSAPWNFVIKSYKMFSWKEFEKSKEILSHMGGPRYRDDWGQHHLTIRPIDLLDWIKFLKEELGFFTMTDIAAREDEVVYHLLNMGTHQRLNLHLIVKKGEIIPSVV